MRSFVEIPRVTSSNNISRWRKLFGQVESSIRNLKSLNTPTNSYDALLVPLISEKLPTDIRVVIPRKFDSEVWDLKEMLKIFKTEIEAKERSFSMISIHRQ